MRRIGRLWRRFWLGPVDPAPLRAVRVGFGLCVLWYLWGNRWLLEAYFGPGRYLEASGLFEQLSSLAVSAVAPYDPLALVQALYAATAVAAALLIAGVLALPAAIACFFLLATWVNLGQLSAGSTQGDLVLRALAFPLVCAALGGHLAGPRRSIPAWPLRMLQLQASLAYLVQGMVRLESTAWRDGRSLCQLATDAAVAPALLCGGFGWLLSYAWPAAQVALALLLWVPLGRRKVLGMAFCLHAFAAVTLRVPMDNEVMVVLLLAFTGGRAPAPTRLPTTESAR